ncbi:hypothetical protein NDU88_001007 [Pleurodeles waltl]|uniref:Uncharacterized protein n=1 Tax=Pleurodeles waltl TaxID=8319 RepID=A0AAV7MJP4_PLEWA|nr:hypothetical protein NDU88_001007 [Pleurodeles waltl]
MPGEDSPFTDRDGPPCAPIRLRNRAGDAEAVGVTGEVGGARGVKQGPVWLLGKRINALILYWKCLRAVLQNESMYFIHDGNLVLKFRADACGAGAVPSLAAFSLLDRIARTQALRPTVLRTGVSLHHGENILPRLTGPQGACPVPVSG